MIAYFIVIEYSNYPFSKSKKEQKSFYEDTNDIFYRKYYYGHQLGNYKIKLYKEFLKHFKNFINVFLHNMFISLIKRIKKLKHEQSINTKKYIYREKKNITKKKPSKTRNNFLKENKSNLSYLSKSLDNYNFDRVKNIRKNEDNFLLSQTISKNSVPILLKNLKSLTIQAKPSYKRDKISKSPSFKIGNRIVINPVKSGGKELFRDLKEINKKYEQIKRRKRKLGLIMNKSVDNLTKIKDSSEYNQFYKIRGIIKKNESIKNERIHNGRYSKTYYHLNYKNCDKNKKYFKNGKTCNNRFKIIKDIKTSDNLIHINIKYYFSEEEKNFKKMKYNNLSMTKENIIIIRDNNKTKNLSKFKTELNSIIEEEELQKKDETKERKNIINKFIDNNLKNNKVIYSRKRVKEFHKLKEGQK